MRKLKVALAGRNHRRTERVPVEGLRVRIDASREGVLVDLSESGALVQLETEPPSPQTQVTLAIEWSETTLHLPARIVRSAPHHVQDVSPSLEQTVYRVGMEFLGIGPDSVAALREIIQSHTRPPISNPAS
jgi:hypothetical protein